MKKKHIPFNVINFDFNSKKFEPYDVMPYLIGCYTRIKRKKECPKTFEDFKKFVESKSLYMYWSRCEYEIILSDWPGQSIYKKIDVHDQLMMNIDTVTNVLMSNVIKSQK